MFLQGSVEGFSLSIEISWMASRAGNQQKSQNVATAWMFWAPRSLQHSKSLLRTSFTLPELGMQLWDPTHLQLLPQRTHPSRTPKQLEFILIPCAVKIFSKEHYRSLNSLRKMCCGLHRDPPLFWELITEVIHCSVFMGYCCPSPLRLPELANAIFICLCSCCTADTDNTSVVFSASTNRELAHLNNLWTGSNLAARLDFSQHSTGQIKTNFCHGFLSPQLSLTPVYQYITRIIAQSITCHLPCSIFQVLLNFQVQSNAEVLAVTHTRFLPGLARTRLGEPAHLSSARSDKGSPQWESQE